MLHQTHKLIIKVNEHNNTLDVRHVLGVSKFYLIAGKKIYGYVD